MEKQVIAGSHPGERRRIRRSSRKNDPLNLIFHSRALARDYRRILAASKRQLKARIIRRQYDGIYIANEKEIR